MFTKFTGSDDTSFFWMHGKIKAWNAWIAFPDASTAFMYLTDRPDSVPSEIFDIIQKFVCVMYGSSCNEVDQVFTEY